MGGRGPGIQDSPGKTWVSSEGYSNKKIKEWCRGVPLHAGDTEKT